MSAIPMRPCKQCGEPMEAKRERKEFCSGKCRIRWHTKEREKSIRREERMLAVREYFREVGRKGGLAAAKRRAEKKRQESGQSEIELAS